MPDFKICNLLARVGLKAADPQYAPAGGGATRPYSATADSSGTSDSFARSALVQAHTNSLVVSVVDFIARNGSTPPLVLERTNRQRTQFVPDHPLIQVLNRPNEDMSGIELLNVTCWGIYLSRKGLAFWHKDRNVLGRVMGLTYLPHDKVERFTGRNRDGELRTYYRYSPEGTPAVNYPAHDIVQIRLGPDPLDPTLGRCPLASLGRWLAIDNSGGEWIAALLRNRAVPGLTMSVKPGIDPLNEDQMEKVKAHAEAEFAGANRGKTAFVGIPMDMHQMGFNPSDMDLSAQLHIAEQRVSSVTGVQPASVGFGAGSAQSRVGAAMREVDKQSWVAAIIPYQQAVVRQIVAQLMPDFEPPETLGQYSLSFNLSGVEALQESANEQADRLRQDAQAGLLSEGEWRAERGFDQLPGPDYFLRPFNLVQVPVGYTGPPPSSPALASASLQSFDSARLSKAINRNKLQAVSLAYKFVLETCMECGHDWDAHDDIGCCDESRVYEGACCDCGTARDLHTSSPKPGLFAGQQWRSRLKALGIETKASLSPLQAGVIEALNRDFDRLVEVFSDDLVPLFEDLGQRVSAAFLELAPAAAALSNGHAHKNGLDSLTPMTQAVAVKQTDDDIVIVQRILARFDLASWQNDRIGPLFLQHYRRTMDGTVNSINAVLRVGVNIPDPVARQIIAQGGTRLGLLDIETDTRDAIFRALHAGRENGEGPAQLARRIRQHVGAGPYTTLEANRPGAGVRYRATTIARTEIKHAQNASSIEAYQRSEAVIGLTVVDAQGAGDTDEECMALDGMDIEFGDVEAIGLTSHPRCTRSFAPRVAE